MGKALDAKLNPDLDAGVRRNRRRALGIISYLLGCLLAVATVLFGIFGLDSNLNGLVFGGVVVVLVLATYFLLKAAECFFVPSVRDALALDARAPVVFLRAFGEDKPLVYDVIPSGESTISVEAKAEDFLISLNAVGPLVSIAEPNRLARLGMHPLGAYRDFVGPGDWQARVQELLDQAGMVVLTIGDSPGIEWEITQARERVGPESLLLYLPPRPAKAFSRKGRAKKEQAVYDAFKPLIERHFDLNMPPFSEATYIIGFDDAGRPVLPTDMPASKWSFTEHARVGKAIRGQLAAVLGKVRPEVNLGDYELLGRPGLWIRLTLTAALALAPLLMLFSSQQMKPDGVLSIGLFIASNLPSVMVIAGWVLLARYFKRLWVWSIPLLLGLSFPLSIVFRWPRFFLENYDFKFWLNLFSSLSLLIHLLYATAVLAIGLVMFTKRTATKANVPPQT